MNLNDISSKYHELQNINKRLNQIETKQDKLDLEIKKFKSYYSQNTKFENWEIDCFIFNLSLDYDNLSFEKIPLLQKANELENELANFSKKFSG